MATTRVSGVVEQLGSKAVNTRYGMKNTFSFKVDGNWYKTAFKNHGLSVGDNVQFDTAVGPYGNDVDLSSIVRSGVATPTPASPSTKAVDVPPATKSYRNGSFPIDPLDGQRSIIRQNALTNARELVQQTIKPGGVFVTGETVDVILSIARKFEAYTSGDIEAEAAKAPATKEDKTT